MRIELPSYVGTYACSDEQAEVAKLLGEAGAEGPWHKSNREIHPFQVLVFRQGRFESHLGIAVGGGKLVHVQSADQVKIEDFSQPRWRSRLAGHYHHTRAACRGLL
ncbi:MAG: C40 family peptidase [Rhodobacteraceae bacterium]|nr:C40 family peptidase [Paracoccaceae bacterium]